MTIQLSYELEQTFRRIALNKYGAMRGKLSLCAVEAIEEWCKKHDN